MIELYGLFDDGEILNLKFSKSNLDNLDDSEIFAIFEMEYVKRFHRYNVIRYLSCSPDFDLG